MSIMKKVTVGGKEIKYKVSPLTAVVFERLTGRCLFATLGDMKDNQQANVTFYLNLLFSIAWGANKDLEFEDFSEKLGEDSKGGLSIFTDQDFIKSMIKIITEEFGIEFDESAFDTAVSEAGIEGK